ncbi:phosphate ABC transporter substrate-binding/OmpA family protein [Pseudomonas sp. N040]|nr:phosphate ABC transporter substrate-binding/OmpA family protein [Pseudomonas sp. N040]MBW7014394.1 phosphate ABC transporter substrate-binding/OmpA family protein [Pseudomonas sp. N040]
MLVLGLACYALPWPVLAQLPGPAATEAVLRVQGSNTIGAKLGPALAKGLLEQQGLRDITVSPSAENEQQVVGHAPDGRVIRISLAAHGSGTGFTALQDGSAELAASSRPIKGAEAQSLEAYGDLRSRSAEQIIAIDGLAIIVHPDNPLQSLNIEQLAALFAGEISDWRQLGGQPGAVHLYARDDNSGTWDTFKELVLGRQGKTLSSSARRFESSDQLSDSVSQDPLGIGFIGLPYIRESKALAIADGESLPMLPSRELIATEDYPLSRRLFFYLKPAETNEWARALVSFAQSAPGQAIVAQSGFIAQTVQATTVQTTSEMPEAYRVLGLQAKRLTVNLRFREGSATLDNKAHYDIARISEYLKRNDKLYRKVVLVGFGDPKPDPERASLLSKLRAVVVSQALRSEGLIPREVVGFGDELPVAANSADEGRKKNQRVEVWVY